MSDPVRIQGVVYRSVCEAARALGRSRHTIVRALDRGDPDSAVARGRGHPGKPVTLADGRTFPSRAAAAAALGLTPTAVYRHLAKPDPAKPDPEARP